MFFCNLFSVLRFSPIFPNQRPIFSTRDRLTAFCLGQWKCDKNPGSLHFEAFISFLSAFDLHFKDGTVTDVLKDLNNLIWWVDIVLEIYVGIDAIDFECTWIASFRRFLFRICFGRIWQWIEVQSDYEDAPVGVSDLFVVDFNIETNAAISSSEPILEGEVTIDKARFNFCVGKYWSSWTNRFFLWTKCIWIAALCSWWSRVCTWWFQSASFEFVTSRLYGLLIQRTLLSEALVSGWTKQGNIVLRGGVGMGIVLESAQWRALASLEYSAIGIGDQDRDGLLIQRSLC